MKSKIFKKPDIAPIVRDNDIIRPELKGTSREETFKTDFISPAKEELHVQGVEPVKFLDPFQRWANEKLDIILGKSAVVEAEAIALQNKIVSQIDRKLTNAPSNIIEALNSVIEGPALTQADELSECQLSCVAVASGMYGQQADEDVSAKIEDIGKNSQNDIAAFQNEANNIGPKVTGLWLFFFMVRFIVAFAIHVTLGFLCCYLRNKLVLKVGPFRVYFGRKIAVPLGNLEGILKDLLGFPCGTPENPQCLEPGKSPVEDQFRMFQCCQPDWASCGTSEGDAQLALPSFGTCFNNVIRRVADEASGDPGSPDGQKPCRVGQCEPEEWNQREREAAKLGMSWLLAKSQAIKNSLSEAERSQQYPQMQPDIDFFYADKATAAIDTSRSSRTMVAGFKSSFNENYQYTGTYTLNGRGQRCDVSLNNNNPFGGLNSFGNITQDDIKKALKNNVDTSFVSELRAAEAEGTTLNFDASVPPEMEPFRTLYQTVNLLDDTLGSILDELRKVVVSGKMLSNLLTDKVFCCVIYSIVVLANLIKYKKLCPEKDMAELFSYAQDFGNNNDVKNIIKFLKLLQKLIDALNAELLGGLDFTGLGLPLGTMLELLKKAIANTIVALLAIALAPIDNALTELENNARLKALLNDNCFGIGDLFGMLGCGIKWIYDLIKKWAMELIPFKAKNIELLGNFRIVAGYKSKFLAKLSDILKMLIDLLTGIGDCFPPEKVPAAIMAQLQDQPVGAAPIVMPPPAVPPIAGKGITTYTGIKFEDIGNRVVDSTGPVPLEVFPDSRLDVINEMKSEATNPTQGLGFPIYSEVIKIGFVDLVALRNGLSLPTAVPSDEVDFTNLTPGQPAPTDPAKEREKKLQEVLNMVQNLKDFK